MPRDGTGQYNLPQPAAVTGTPISSAAYNSTTTDIAAALTGSLARDGQAAATGNQNLGGFRLTNIGAAAAGTDAAQAAQVQSGAFLWAGNAGGTANALTATITPSFAAYVTGQVIRFVNAPGPNTSATVTLNVNTLGAKEIKKWAPAGKVALAVSDLRANAILEVLYDGTDFVWMGSGSTAANRQRGRAVYTTAGTTTFTPAAGVTRLFVKVWAGGGGGGGADAGGIATGGGGGGYAESVINVVPGTSYSLTVGAGGAAGTGGPSPSNGGAGGASTFAGLVEAIGGGLGVAAAGGIQTTGGAAGNGTVGDALFVGTPCTIGYLAGGIYFNSQGGGAPFLPNNRLIPTGGTAGDAGVSFGCGGNGGTNVGNGGAGAAGLIIVEW